MSKHITVHKSSRKKVSGSNAAAAQESSPRPSDGEVKLSALGALLAPNGLSNDGEHGDLGSPRPSHNNDNKGDQPTTLQVPRTTADGKAKPNENTKKTKKASSKDDKSRVKTDKHDDHHKGYITKEEIEATLERQRYLEDDIDLEQLKAKLHEEEEEKCYEWIDKTINRMLFNTAILTLMTALMSAYACYIFVQVPYYIYSHHIFREIFLYSDALMEQNGYPKASGLHNIAPLPIVVVVMYAVVVYFIYLVNYPKRPRIIHYLRVVLFLSLEVYLSTCVISYIVDAGKENDRLDQFFKMDKLGIKGIPWDKTVSQLKFLERSQEYFGCCGYRSNTEWSQIHPTNYSDKWPLTCCDEEKSGIACYGPVEKTVVFFMRPLDEEEFIRYVNKRLFEDICFPKERTLCLTVISLVTFSTVIFVVFSTWTAIIFLRLSHMLVSKELELREKDQ